MFTPDQLTQFMDRVDTILPENPDDAINMMTLTLAAMACDEGYTDEDAVERYTSALALARRINKRMRS